jgi:two-component system LytT family response regulator
VPFTALIADADERTRVRLGLFVRELDGIEVVSDTGDGPEAVAAIATMQPDLLFLGTRLGHCSGFEVLRAVADLPLPGLIFLVDDAGNVAETVQQFAFPVLSKPVEREAVHEVVTALSPQLQTRSRQDLTRIRSLIDTMSTQQYTRRLVVRRHGTIEVIPVGAVDWLEAAANYVKLHIGDSTSLMRATMRSMEEQLDPGRFVRIHRSIMVNGERVQKVAPWYHGDAVVILTDGTRLNLSRTYRPRLEEFLGRSASSVG